MAPWMFGDVPEMWRAEQKKEDEARRKTETGALEKVVYRDGVSKRTEKTARLACLRCAREGCTRWRFPLSGPGLP